MTHPHAEVYTRKEIGVIYDTPPDTKDRKENGFYKQWSSVWDFSCQKDPWATALT
jgi:hypothetical protein